MMNNRDECPWHQQWLVTDGEHVYRVANDPLILEELDGKHAGQLVMAPMRLKRIRNHIAARLKEGGENEKALDASHFDGKLESWGVAG